MNIADFNYDDFSVGCYDDDLSDCFSDASEYYLSEESACNDELDDDEQFCEDNA
jgi:hypothetical protein